VSSLFINFLHYFFLWFLPGLWLKYTYPQICVCLPSPAYFFLFCVSQSSHAVSVSRRTLRYIAWIYTIVHVRMFMTTEPSAPQGKVIRVYIDKFLVNICNLARTTSSCHTFFSFFIAAHASLKNVFLTDVQINPVCWKPRLDLSYVRCTSPWDNGNPWNYSANNNTIFIQ